MGKKWDLKFWLHLSIRLQHLKELLIFSPFAVSTHIRCSFCGVCINALDLMLGCSCLWAGDPKNDFLHATRADFVNVQPCCSRYKENLMLPWAFLLLEGCCLQGSPARCSFSLPRRNLLSFPWVLVTTSRTLPLNPQIVALTGWKMRKAGVTWSFWSILQVQSGRSQSSSLWYAHG